MKNQRIRARTYRVEGQDICWVGACPWTRGLCFGTETGHLAIELPPANGDETISTFELCDAPINGVAFLGDFVAASSPDHVRIARVDRSQATLQLQKVAQLEIGAHGVVLASNGSFVASLGYDGLALGKTTASGKVDFKVSTPRDEELNFYKLVRLGGDSAGDAFACAVRRDGLLLLSLDAEGKHAATAGHHMAECDVVGVASLGRPALPRGVVCVSRDGQLFFFRDAGIAAEPVPLEFADVAGVAYEVLVSQDHLFLLTSQALIAFPGLIDRFVRGESLQGGTPSRELPVEASSAAVVAESLLVVRDDHVASYSIAKFVATNEGPRAPAQADEFGETDIRSEVRIPKISHSDWDFDERASADFVAGIFGT